jgi:hypothetical protein
MPKTKKIYYKGYEISWNPYFKKWQVPGYCVLFGTIDMAKEAVDEALEKEKPKKVVSMETTNKFKNPYGYHPAYGHCPVCGRIYWDKYYVGNYCDNCGQRLEVNDDDM